MQKYSTNFTVFIYYNFILYLLEGEDFNRPESGGAVEATVSAPEIPARYLYYISTEHSSSELTVIWTKGYLDYIEGLGYVCIW